MPFYTDKSILVTGGTGMIGRLLVEMLIEQGGRVRIGALDDPSRAHPDAEFHHTDLRDFGACQSLCRDIDCVFHVAGIKGSPAMTARQPASFFTPLLMMNTNMMEAARSAGVKRYLFTSTIGVYAPAEVFHEDDVWKTFPSENDRFAGWAKRMGELQAEAYAIEYDWDQVAIVRPANVYGPFDNFDPDNAMVIPSLIHRVMAGENPLKVWGDGSAVRDFIHARDVARGMMMAMEKMPGTPINLGSGKGVSVKEIVDILVKVAPHPLSVEWDTSKPAGDPIRVMDTTRAQAMGFEPEIAVEDGIRSVIEWYAANREQANQRYNVFKEHT